MRAASVSPNRSPQIAVGMEWRQRLRVVTEQAAQSPNSKFASLDNTRQRAASMSPNRRDVKMPTIDFLVKAPSIECEVEGKAPSVECEVEVKAPSVECEVEVEAAKMPSVEVDVDMKAAGGAGVVRTGSLSIVRGTEWRERFSDVSREAQVSPNRNVNGVRERAASLSPYRSDMQAPSIDFLVKAPSVECEVEVKAPSVECEVEVKAPSVECEVEGKAPSVEVEVEVEVVAKAPKMASLECDVEVKAPVDAREQDNSAAECGPLVLQACQTSDLDLLRGFLAADSQGSLLTYRDPEVDCTPLIWAVYWDQVEILRLLIEFGAPLECKGGEFGRVSIASL